MNPSLNRDGYRTITSGVTTDVSVAPLGHIQLDHKAQGESVAIVEMSYADAKKLFYDLSHALGHHTPPV